MKPKDPIAQKAWKTTIKKLLLSLWATVKLADNEMQTQKERVFEEEHSQKREKLLTPMERIILQRAQRIR